MAFNSITETEIEPGQPVRADTALKSKTNFDDHELRLQSLEGGASTTYPPMILRVNGPYAFFGVQNGVLKTTTNFPILIQGVRLLVDVAGTGGSTEIDIKFSRSGGAYTSILTTKPVLAHSAGNDAINAGVVNPTYATLLAGDIIRLDTTSVQTNGRGFTVRIDYTRG